jgi:hypothetical protein
MPDVVLNPRWKRHEPAHENPSVAPFANTVPLTLRFTQTDHVLGAEWPA